MNKLQKIALSILGGVDVTFYIFTPILISIMWIGLVQLTELYIYFIFSLGLLATFFRALKVGWLKNE